MKLHHFIILVVAAGAGVVYYQRFSAFSNISHLGADKKKIHQEEIAEKSYHLVRASAEGKRKTVQLLLSQGVNVDSRDAMRHTSLMLASMGGYDDICAILLASGASVHLRDRNGYTAYDYASGHGRVATLELLFSHSKTADTQNHRQFAALMAASMMANPTLLPDAGQPLTTINRITPDNRSALHVVASIGAYDMAKILIERGADVNLKNRDEQIPLHWAAWNNRENLVQMLIEKGAKINAIDKEGNSPLHFAVQNNALDTARLLLALGADKYLVNKRGDTPRTLAQDLKHTKIMALMP